MRQRGRVSAVSREQGEIFIKDADGTLLQFSKAELVYRHEFELLREGMLLAYDRDEGGLSNVQILDEDDPQALLYVEPKTFQVLGRPPFAEYELFDYGKFILAKGSRDEQQARSRLIALCREVGANCVIDYELKEELRIAMGFGFNYYYACGVPGVIAREADQGEVSIQELHSRLDHERIRRLGNMLANIRIGRLAFKILAVLLFAVFVIGFIAAQ